MPAIEKDLRHTSPADSGASRLAFTIKGQLTSIVDIPSSVLVTTGTALDPLTDYVTPDAPNGSIGSLRLSHDTPYVVSVVDDIIMLHEGLWKTPTVGGSGDELYSYAIGTVVDDKISQTGMVGLKKAEQFNKQVVRIDDTVVAPADVTLAIETARIPMDARFENVTRDIQTTDYNEEKHYIRLLKVTLANPIVQSAFVFEGAGGRPGMYLRNRGTKALTSFHVVLP